MTIASAGLALSILAAPPQAAPASPEPAAAASPSSAAASTARKEVPWTVLIYGAADNNADGHMLDFLNGIRRAVADDPGLEIVVFMDRSLGFSKDTKTFGEDFTGARIYRMREKTAERQAGGDEFPEITLDADWEADSADPANLRKFLRFGKARFPARHYGLLIYSHADGITMCPDEQSSRSMSIPALSTEVDEEDGVDFMGLELCNMGGVEVAYQWRPGSGGFSTEVLLGIPNAGPPLDWNRIFARIHTKGHPGAAGRSDCIDPVDLTARDFGRLGIEAGYEGRLAAAKAEEGGGRGANESGAAYDLSVAEKVKHAVDAFAVALAEQEGAKSVMEELRGPGPSGTVMNYVEGQFDGAHPFVDLYDLLKRAADCEKLGDDARAAARAALAATDELVIDSFGMSAYPGFERGKHGIFVAFPGGGAPVRPSVSGRRTGFATMDWYVPFDVPSKEAPLGGWSWCKDGATRGDHVVGNWFELIDSWFDLDEDGRGGANGWAW
jgi:clostripain